MPDSNAGTPMGNSLIRSKHPWGWQLGKSICRKGGLGRRDVTCKLQIPAPFETSDG